MISIKPKVDTPANRAIAAYAEEYLNRPESQEWVATETRKEFMRQVGYGLPPSEGMPDVRPRYPRWTPPLSKTKERE